MKRKSESETPLNAPVKKPMSVRCMTKFLAAVTVEKYIENNNIIVDSFKDKFPQLTDDFFKNFRVCDNEDEYYFECEEEMYKLLCEIYNTTRIDPHPIYITPDVLWDCFNIKVTSTRSGLDQMILNGMTPATSDTGVVTFWDQKSKFFWDLYVSIDRVLGMYTSKEFEQLEPKFGPVKITKAPLGYYVSLNTGN
jgi:hypothetical protein